MNERIIDRIAAFCGSLPFFYLNAAWFAAWLVINALTPFRFDGYPFSFLTLSVSLEAIFLSIFVLISQNRQAAADREMEQRDCEINERAEQEIRQIMGHLEKQDERLRAVVELFQVSKPLRHYPRRKKDEVIQ